MPSRQRRVPPRRQRPRQAPPLRLPRHLSRHPRSLLQLLHPYRLHRRSVRRRRPTPHRHRRSLLRPHLPRPPSRWPRPSLRLHLQPLRQPRRRPHRRRLPRPRRPPGLPSPCNQLQLRPCLPRRWRHRHMRPTSRARSSAPGLRRATRRGPVRLPLDRCRRRPHVLRPGRRPRPRQPSVQRHHLHPTPVVLRPVLAVPPRPVRPPALRRRALYRPRVGPFRPRPARRVLSRPLVGPFLRLRAAPGHPLLVAHGRVARRLVLLVAMGSARAGPAARAPAAPAGRVPAVSAPGPAVLVAPVVSAHAPVAPAALAAVPAAAAAVLALVAVALVLTANVVRPARRVVLVVVATSMPRVPRALVASTSTAMPRSPKAPSSSSEAHRPRSSLPS